MKARDFFYCLVIFLPVVFVISRKPGNKITVTRHTDTVYLRDTIREVIPPPRTLYVTRVDTVTVYVPVEAAGAGDTIMVPLAVPIEDKEYVTDNFRALVRGFRPELVSLDLFPESRTVYNTEIQRIRQRPRFGVGIQAGYGYSARGSGPYIGIGVQYNLWSF